MNVKLQRAEKRSILGAFPEEIAGLVQSRALLRRKETDMIRDGLWLCMIHALEASVDGYKPMIDQPQHDVAIISRGGSQEYDKPSTIGDEIWHVRYY